MSSVKIAALELENVKRVKAVAMEPTANGLTIIGGNNNQGKTSVIDAIAWALGGNKMKPSKATREGSMIPPKLDITLSNGIRAVRDGKNSDLKVIDTNGNKQGQTLLDSFINEFALNLPKFMNSNNKEKATTLLQIIGVGDELLRIEMQEKKLYDERHTLGQIADQKKKYAAEQPSYADAPNIPVSASELIKQQQEILARNGENQKKRQNLEYIRSNHNSLLAQMEELKQKISASEIDLQTAEKSALDLHDESTEELEKNIESIEEINVKVRANMDKEKAEEDAKQYKEQYDAKTEELEEVRKQKTDLLQGADLPLEGLSVEDGNLVYLGQQWDNMSGSQQLIVATSIVRKLNPDCGFVIMDKLEQLDSPTLKEFNEWLVKEDLQVIGTRVSTGEECSVVIEDGYVLGNKKQDVAPSPTWEAGKF